MEFPYVKFEGEQGTCLRPHVPVTISYKGKSFPVGNALVDTGSDITILPLEVAHLLRIQLDDSATLRLSSAGGGIFVALPSRNKVEYTIEKKGFRPIHWEGTVYFAEDEPIILLGHLQCLEYFDVTFYGPEKKVSLLPRFKN